jgi:hypothetical protein
MEKPLGVFSLPLHYPPDIDHSRLAQSSMTTVEVKPAEDPSASSIRDQTESSCAISATSASFAASLISGIPAHFPTYLHVLPAIEVGVLLHRLGHCIIGCVAFWWRFAYFCRVSCWYWHYDRVLRGLFTYLCRASHWRWHLRSSSWGLSTQLSSASHWHWHLRSGVWSLVTCLLQHISLALAH